LLFGALLSQVGITVAFGGSISPAAGLALTMATYCAIAGFVVLNRRLPGVAIAGVGIALNALVIGSNGAMPVSAAASDIARVDEMVGDPSLKHEEMTDATRLAFLGDVLPVPIPYLNSVLSLGDVILLAGAAMLVYDGMVERRVASRPSA
jgi:hypothetical protein